MKLRIEKKERYKHVLADEDISSGELVLWIIGKEYPHPTEYTIQIDDNLYVDDPIAREIMHSLDPSCELRNDKIYSLHRISKNREITLNYYDTNDIVFKVFRDIETGEMVATKFNPKYNNEE
jgi:hypothetical protein